MQLPTQRWARYLKCEQSQDENGASAGEIDTRFNQLLYRSLPLTMVTIIILKIDTGRVIIKYRPTKTNPKYFLPANCHLNGPI